MGKMFLILIDSHSKWMDVHTVPSATSHSTISVLRTIFASHGLPEILVSDNGQHLQVWNFEFSLGKMGYDILPQLLTIRQLMV